MSGYNSVTQGYLGGGSSGGGPATSVPISGLTAAVATNAIDNAGYAQGWNWDSLSLNKALSLSANTSLAAGNAQTILAVELSGANANSTQTTYAAQFSNTHTGTASTNVAAKFTASGGTANIAIQASGIVAITSPVVNGTGVSAGLSIIANSLTTGNGVDISTTSLRTGTVMKLTSSGTALQSTTSNVLSIISSGVNVNNGVTATGATISVTNTNVTSGTNVGLSITATGATTANYALKLVDGSQGVSKVLTSDANGNASWQTPAGSSLFPLTGTGTATGNITGDLASNTLSIMNGNVGIGVTPSVALDVVGDLIIRGATGLVGVSATDATQIVNAYTDAGQTLELNGTSGNAVLFSGANGLTINSSTGNNMAGTVQFSSYGAGALTTDASGNITAVSDERMKRNIKTYNAGLQEVMKLNPITYQYNVKSKLDTVNIYAGFSAQNVKANIPYGTGVDKNGMLTLQERPILAAAINAIKELSAKVDKLESQNKQLLKQLGATGNRNK